MKQIWPPRLSWSMGNLHFSPSKRGGTKTPNRSQLFFGLQSKHLPKSAVWVSLRFLLKAWSRPKQLTSKVSSDQFLHVQALKVLRYLGMTSGATGPWIHVPISSMRRNYSELCMAWERFQQWCQVTRSARFHGNNQGENNASPTNQQILQQCSMNILTPTFLDHSCKSFGKFSAGH